MPCRPGCSLLAQGQTLCAAGCPKSPRRSRSEKVRSLGAVTAWVVPRLWRSPPSMAWVSVVACGSWGGRSRRGAGHCLCGRSPPSKRALLAGAALIVTAGSRSLSKRSLRAVTAFKTAFWRRHLNGAGLVVAAEAGPVAPLKAALGRQKGRGGQARSATGGPPSKSNVLGFKGGMARLPGRRQIGF